MYPVTFTLLAALAISAPPSPPYRVAVLRADEVTHFYADGELVTSYHHGQNSTKPYLWPLNAPGSIPVTRAWPLDATSGSTRDCHHHQSAWIGHGDVIPEGVEILPKRNDIQGIDFWSEREGRGTIMCSTIVVTDRQPGRAEARTTNVWKTAGGKAIVDEERQIELYNLGNARLLVVTSSLKPAGIPVTFADTDDGFIAVRVSDQLRIGDTEASIHRKNTISNSDRGQGESACRGRKANWCAFAGEVDGKRAGIALFEDPANKPRSYWHVRNYGLLAANPFMDATASSKESGHRGIRLKPGSQLTLRYGILLYSNDASVADAYRKFLALLP